MYTGLCLQNNALTLHRPFRYRMESGTKKLLIFFLDTRMIVSSHFLPCIKPEVSVT